MLDRHGTAPEISALTVPGIESQACFLLCSVLGLFFLPFSVNMFVKAHCYGRKPEWSRGPQSGSGEKERGGAECHSMSWRVTAFYLKIPGNSCKSTKLRGTEGGRKREGMLFSFFKGNKHHFWKPNFTLLFGLLWGRSSSTTTSNGAFVEDSEVHLEVRGMGGIEGISHRVLGEGNTAVRE